MSTEAMREAFQKLHKYPMADDYESETFAKGWQAATANQEALIKAALDAAAEKCENQRYMVLEPLRTYSAEDVARSNKSSAKHLARLIRQITSQQVMERMK